MKLISWNVNGIRACMGKGFLEVLKELDADIFCIQETKMQEGQAEVPAEGYFQYWCSAEKKGYSGTALFTKKEPQSVSYGIGVDVHDHEGRVITAEYESFYLVNVYVPNSQNELKRLDYRMSWEEDFRRYVCELDAKKPVIICGDMNVAHKEIDLKNPKTNVKNAGFTPDRKSSESGTGCYSGRAGKNDLAPGCGIYRQFSLFLPGRGRNLFLVELSV